MTLRVFLKSGEHFDIPNANWKNIFELLDNATDQANKRHAGMNNAVIHNDQFPMWINLEQIAAIAPVASGFIKAT